jgi:hypothetical protein
MKLMKQRRDKGHGRWANARRTLVALLCASLLGGLTASVPNPAAAEVASFGTPVVYAGGISADEATAIVRRKYDGRVISVTPVNGGKGGYKVRVLLDGGRVKTVHVDKNGRIR